MKFCHKCGNPINGESFCSKCGTEVIENGNAINVSEEVLKKTEFKKSNKVLMISTIILCFLILFLTGGYFLYSKYQTDKAEKEKVVEEQRIKALEVQKQKEKEAKEQKAREEEKKKEKESKELSKAESNSHLAGIALFENGKYVKYLNIIGTPLALVSVDYNTELNNGVLDVKRYDRADIPNDKTNSVNWMQLKLDTPLNSEAVLSTMNDLPLMRLDSEKGYFVEEDVTLVNGHTVNIYYYIDQTTLSVYNVVITEMKFD